MKHWRTSQFFWQIKIANIRLIWSGTRGKRGVGIVNEYDALQVSPEARVKRWGKLKLLCASTMRMRMRERVLESVQ